MPTGILPKSKAELKLGVWFQLHTLGKLLHLWASVFSPVQ